MAENFPKGMGIELSGLRAYTNIKLPDIKPFNPNEEYYANEYYDRLKKLIIEFEVDLKDDEEVGLKLVNFGESITIHVESIGYYNPTILTFYGTTTEGSPAQLIQDVTQLNLLLVKVPRIHPERPRIGYKLQHEGENKE